MTAYFAGTLAEAGLMSLIEPQGGDAQGLSAAGRDRLDRLAAILDWQVTTDAAQVRVTAPEVWPGFAALPSPDLIRALAAAVLALPHNVPAASIRARLPAIAIRVDSALRASLADDLPVGDAGAAHLQAAAVDVSHLDEAYAGFFAVEEYQLSHPLFDGRRTPTLARAVLVSGDAVVVLPYDAVRDRVLLLTQFRAGAFARGDRWPWLVETVAGRIDPGETPTDAARREAREEAGIDLGALIALPQYYPSPGALSEYIYPFIGAADLPDDLPRLGGLADEGEDLRLLLVSLPDALAMMHDGQIRNAPVQLALMALCREREAIRRRFGVETDAPDA